MIITVSESAVFSKPEQTHNDNNSPSYKWFSLQENKLDGTYHPIDSTGASEIGWWGTTFSDANGYIATEPQLIVDYETPRIVHALRIAGDFLLNEFPADFTVELYNNGTLVYAEEVVGNDKVEWVHNFTKGPHYSFDIATTGQIYDVTKLVLTVKRINKPNRVVKITEISTLFEIYRSDTLSIDLSEQKITLDYLIVSSDFVFVSASEINLPVIVHLSGSEEVILLASEQKNVQAHTVQSDVFGLNINENDSLTAILSKEDTIKLTSLIEPIEYSYDTVRSAVNITVEFTKTDQLLTELDEIKEMRNIHTVMDAPSRKIYGKVEITYSDPFLDETITATASEAGRYTDPKYTADNIQSSQYKWFSLHSNKLDGSFHPMPSDNKNTSVGWWGTTFSDVNGVLPVPVSLTVQFEARPIYTLKVVGDDKLNEYPVDFTIQLYDEVNTVLYTETVVNNNSVLWTKDIPDINGVTKMVLTVTKINKPNSVVKITEFYTAVTETYLDEDIVFIHLLEEQTFDDMTLPIGNVSANEIDIRLKNVNRKFDPSNKNSPLYGLLKRNRRMRAWLGAEVKQGEIEWYPLGVFWTLDWNAPNSQMYVDTTGRDRLELMRLTDFTKSQVYQDYSLYQLAEIVLQDYGLKPEEYVLDPKLENIIIPYAWFDRISHRDALAQIAAAGLARLYCDREGRVVMTVFEPADYPLYEFTKDWSIIDMDHPLAWSQITNVVEVKSSPLAPGPTEEIYRSLEVITVPAGGEYSETIRFNEVPCLEVQAPSITAGPNVYVKSYTIYAWGMDVTYQNTGLTDETITEVIIQGKKLKPTGSRVAIARDERSIRDNGIQKKTIENPFIQSFQRAQEIADSILATYKDPRHDVTLETRGNIALQLGDRVTAPDDNEETKTDYFIVRQDINWDGSLMSRVQAQKIGG